MNEEQKLVESAVAGDQAALGALLESVRDMVFTLSLRMLGSIPDAEDASQEIMVRVMTGLSSFRGESSFATWVFRIAANHLKSYKKSMFAQRPLSFEFYGSDIENGVACDLPDTAQNVDRDLLAEELKMSCTNVMLQCLSPDDRCVYVLGTMFKLDSRTAADILDLTPDAYRQRLSRIRKRMAEFLGQYCGLGGGPCRCAGRVGYAAAQRRIDPHNPAFTRLAQDDTASAFKDAMEEMDGLSTVFDHLPRYQATQRTRELVQELLRSGQLRTVRDA